MISELRATSWSSNLFSISAERSTWRNKHSPQIKTRSKSRIVVAKRRPKTKDFKNSNLLRRSKDCRQPSKSIRQILFDCRYCTLITMLNQLAQGMSKCVDKSSLRKALPKRSHKILPPPKQIKQSLCQKSVIQLRWWMLTPQILISNRKKISRPIARIMPIYEIMKIHIQEQDLTCVKCVEKDLHIRVLIQGILDHVLKLKRSHPINCILLCIAHWI